MSSCRYCIVVDDERSLRDTYRQYLLPRSAVSAMERLRRLRSPSARSGGEGEALLPEGWELVDAESGEAALRLADRIESESSEICIGFFDVKMPGGMDGIETMSRLVDRFPRLRCCVVSAYNDRSVDEINAVVPAGARDNWDFVNKPFTEPEIRQKGRVLVWEWLKAEAEERARQELATVNANLERLVDERTRELLVAQRAVEVSEARMREELEAAAAIQVMFYPRTWELGESFEASSHIEPAAETGGDVCGYFDAGGERALYVCDVTGHGAAAALGTAILCTTLKSIEQERRAANVTLSPLSPAAVMRRLNEVLHDIMQGSLYATCFMAVVQPESGVIRYACAGHEWPLLWRSGSLAVLPILATHVLGYSRDSVYPELTTPFANGDYLLAYSDGLTDAQNAEGKRFDRRRLFHSLRDAPKDSAEAIKGYVLEKLRQFAAPGPPPDDITYFVLGRRGS